MYTYPEALNALQSIASDYIKLLRPNAYAPVTLITSPAATTACVTWDTYGVKITLPVRPAVSLMSEGEYQDWTAYLLHELGHPTHTDQTVWRDAVARGLARMLNALEDVRMEKAVIASGIVPNAKAVLSRLLGRKVIEARADGDWKPNARKDIGWTICVLGRAANGYAFDAADLAWIRASVKPGSTVGAVLSWALPELAACKSTADCLSLAAKISAAIAAPKPQGQQPQPQPQPQPGTPHPEGNTEVLDETSEGDEGEGEGEGEGDEGDEGEGEGEGDEGDEGDEGEGEGEGGQAPGEDENAPSDQPSAPSEPVEGKGKGKGGKGGKGSGAPDDETPVTNERELTETGLAPNEDKANKKLPRQAKQAENTVLNILREAADQSPPRSIGRGIAVRTNAAAVKLRDGAAKASRQRAALARALRANETDDRDGGRRAGRLDRGALSRAMSGAVNVFAKREISEGFDTDVAVLLDASGSMTGANLMSALEAGLVIAQAAGSVGASCTTEIFNSGGYQRAGALAGKRPPAIEDYGALADQACGGTPLSVHMARMSLAQSRRAPGKRRVMFVVTDGICDYGTNTVKRVAAYVEKTYGTVLAHVSIDSPLQGTFKAEVMVPAGKPLAEIGLDHFVRVLQAL